MKRMISTTLAAAVMLGSVAVGTASAQEYYGPPGYNHEPGYVPPGYHLAPNGGWHGWHRGEHFRERRVVVYDYGRYRLRPPPRGYEWVQSNGQFILLAVSTGVIADILLNR
jgi:Ni/Co efflux regulator RcnB